MSQTRNYKRVTPARSSSKLTMIKGEPMTPTTWPAAIAAWRVAMTAENMSPRSLRTYTSYLHKASQIHQPAPWEATTATLRGVVAAYQGKPDAQKSLRSALRRFYEWGQRDGHISENPAEYLAPVRTKHRIADPCPDIIIETAAIEAGEREKLMIYLARDCGLRVSEIARVHSKDLDLDGILRVTGKGNKERLVPILNPTLVSAIRDAQGWLFPSPATTGHLTPGHVSKLLSLALPGRWTGHKLRHSFGTASAEGSPDILALAEVMGHASPATTKMYVRVGRKALINAVAAARRDAAPHRLKEVAA